MYIYIRELENIFHSPILDQYFKIELYTVNTHYFSSVDILLYL